MKVLVSLVILVVAVAVNARPNSLSTLKSLRSLVSRHLASVKNVKRSQSAYGAPPQGGPGYGPGGPNGVNEGPPASVLVAMELMQNGCGPRTADLVTAFSDIINSEFLKSDEMAGIMGGGETGQVVVNAGEEEIQMAACMITNINSLDQVAALTDTPVEELRQVYPTYGLTAEVIIGMIQGEISELDPVKDADKIDGINAVVNMYEILKDIGLFSLS